MKLAKRQWLTKTRYGDEVATAGNTVALYVDSYHATCGGLSGGAVHLGRQGAWVIALEALEEILKRAKGAT